MIYVVHYIYVICYIEQSANEARRAFLRYVFHEVRVPLNSITMGLYILNDELGTYLILFAIFAILPMYANF